VSFIDYLAGRRSGLYFPNPRPPYEKKSATSTNAVMDTVKGEVWKAIASKAASKVLYPSAQFNQQQYLSNFQGFGTNGAPYLYRGQFRLEPSHIIPKPEDIFGFETLELSVWSLSRSKKMISLAITFQMHQESTLYQIYIQKAPIDVLHFRSTHKHCTTRYLTILHCLF
jgi:hypothetical protein